MQAPVDFTRVEPLPRSMTVAAVNSFVLNSARFLNHFARVAEGKLARADADLSRIELSLSLLEAKLASIPGLEGGEYVAAASTSQDAPAPAAPSAPSAETQSSGPPPPAPPPPPGAATSPSAPAVDSSDRTAPVADGPPPAAPHDGPMVKDDPRFARFFKMLKLRIDMRNISVQLQAAGYDPAILKLDPESPAPPEGTYLVGGGGSGSGGGGGGADNADSGDDGYHSGDPNGDAGDIPAGALQSRAPAGGSDGEEWDD